MNFGKELAAWRAKNKITVQRLSRSSSVSRFTISRIEKNPEYKPIPATMAALKQAMKDIEREGDNET